MSFFISEALKARKKGALFQSKKLAKKEHSFNLKNSQKRSTLSI